MEIEANNKSSEGFTKNYKHNTDCKHHQHDLGPHILFCHQYDEENNKYFVHQSNTIQSNVNRYQFSLNNKRNVLQLTQEEEATCQQ